MNGSHLVSQTLQLLDTKHGSHTSFNNDKVKLDHAQLVQTFAFVEGNLHSLILLNLSNIWTISVTLSGVTIPVNEVKESSVTVANITASNDESEKVSIRRQHQSGFNPDAPYPLPPYCMTVLRWKSSR